MSENISAAPLGSPDFDSLCNAVINSVFLEAVQKAEYNFNYTCLHKVDSVYSLLY